MVENKLSEHEFKSLFLPILRLESNESILSVYRNLFGVDINSPQDLIDYCGNYRLLYNEFQVILNFDNFHKEFNNISITCRVPRKWYFSFYNPIKSFISDLKKVCIGEIFNLYFGKFEHDALTTYRTRKNYFVKSIYYYDLSARNYDIKGAKELSPIVIASEKNEEYYFVHFIINSNCYYKNNGQIRLKTDWGKFMYRYDRLMNFCDINF